MVIGHSRSIYLILPSREQRIDQKFDPVGDHNYVGCLGQTRVVVFLCLDFVPNEHVYSISTGEAKHVSCPFVRSIFQASLLQTELICFISFTNRALTGPANEDILTQYSSGSQNRSGFSNYVF